MTSYTLALILMLGGQPVALVKPGLGGEPACQAEAARLAQVFGAESYRADCQPQASCCCGSAVPGFIDRLPRHSEIAPPLIEDSAAVSEPSTLGLLLAGLPLAAIAMWRRV